MTSLRSFASTDRFIIEIASPSTLRPGYVLIGDEIFLYDRCRKAVLATLAPEDTRDFCLHDLDLAETSIFEVLDRAQTPSLMAPFQVLFVRNLKTLYGRGSKKEEFAAVDAYFRSPNPQALILFVADHLRIPTDLRKMDYQDKERYERIRETLGDWCGFVELARVEENDAIKWVTTTAESRGVKFDPDAARELVDSLGADMMLIASEFEKLLLYVSAPAKQSVNENVILSGAQSAESKDLRSPSTSPADTARVPHPSQSHREGWETKILTLPKYESPRSSPSTSPTRCSRSAKRNSPPTTSSPSKPTPSISPSPTPPSTSSPPPSASATSPTTKKASPNSTASSAPAARSASSNAISPKASPARSTTSTSKPSSPN
jgi:DNA polymerase III, delta subunit